MGTKQSEIFRIEGARQNISVEKLARFADAVGTKLDIRRDPVWAQHLPSTLLKPKHIYQKSAASEPQTEWQYQPVLRAAM